MAAAFDSHLAAKHAEHHGTGRTAVDIDAALTCTDGLRGQPRTPFFDLITRRSRVQIPPPPPRKRKSGGPVQRGRPAARERALLGSVCDYAVRNAPCPVLVVGGLATGTDD